MRLLLMRHGHAEGRGPDPALSPDGVEAVRRTLEGDWPAPTRIVHSPLLRARQTAALCATRWPEAALLEDVAFVPSDAADAAARRLLELAEGHEVVALVSHLPLLPALCGWFCDEALDFMPADAVLIEAERASAWRGTFTRQRP